MNQVVLVTGSRGWIDIEIIRKEFIHLASKYPSEIQWTLVHGGCKGADLLSDKVAKEMKWNIISMPVTPDAWKTLGKRAGIMRNTEMINTLIYHIMSLLSRSEIFQGAHIV